MLNINQVVNSIAQQGVLPMFSTQAETASINIAHALYNAGMRVIEYTNRLPESLDNFKKLKAERDSSFKDMLLGVGTVKTVADAHKYIDAGADFIVCPGMIPEVGKVCAEAGLLWSPGCMAVSEIMIAEEVGSPLVKLFPASLLTPSFIGAIKEIFPGLGFMATGGIDLTSQSIAPWFAAGACAVGMGTKLVDKKMVQNGDFAGIEQMARQALQIVAESRPR